MESFRETFEWSMDGSLASAADLPVAILYALVLVFTHSMGRTAGATVAKTLFPVLGKATPAWVLFTSRFHFAGPPACAANVSGDKVRLSFRQRVRPNRLRKIVRALADLPGARDLRLRGQVQRFGERPGSGGMVLDE